MKLDTPTAIFGGLALIAAAYFLSNLFSAGFGPWNMKDDGDYGLWLLNSSNGEIRFCDSSRNTCTRTWPEPPS